MPILFYVLLIPLLILCGCGPEAAVGYDDLHAEMIQDLFEDLEKGDSRAAINDLERLRAVFPDSTFFEQALEREKKKMAVQRLNETLARGDLAQADKLLKQYRRELGAAEALTQASELITALQALEAVAAQLPSAGPAEARRLLEQLVQRQPLLTTIPAFNVWHEAQEQRILRLVELEKERRRQQLARELDLQNVENIKIAGLVMAQMAAADVKLLDELQKKTAHSSRSLEHEIAGKGLMMACGIAYDDSAEDASLTDCLAAAAVGAGNGNWRQSVEYLRELSAFTDLSADHLSAFVLTALLPKEQFSAQPWIRPFPAVTDVVNRVVQIKDHAAGEDTRSEGN